MFKSNSHSSRTSGKGSLSKPPQGLFGKFVWLNHINPHACVCVCVRSKAKLTKFSFSFSKPGLAVAQDLAWRPKDPHEPVSTERGLVSGEVTVDLLGTAVGPLCSGLNSKLL